MTTDNDIPHVQPGVTITREQLEAWADRALTDDEVDQLDDALPHSSIPEAIGVIADSLGRDQPTPPSPGDPERWFADDPNWELS